MNVLTAGLKNKNTTVLGIGALLVLAGSVITSLFDGDPNTGVDWTIVIPGILTAISSIFARDANKTSEATGVK